MVLKVSVLGFGAIGKQVCAGLSTDGYDPLGIAKLQGVKLQGVIVRRPGATNGSYKEFELKAALAQSDLIVECAGGEALKMYGPQIVQSGCDLLAVSVGQLVDTELRDKLLGSSTNNAHGKTYLSTGAVGGLDILNAARRDGGLVKAQLVTTKLPKALVQPWMEEKQKQNLLSTTTPLRVFEGSVKEAITLFPASLNVAVAVAAASGLWEETMVTLIADPQSKLTNHRIEANGPAGSYRFDIENEPSPDNPATSGVVAKALLSGIARLANPGGSFI